MRITCPEIYYLALPALHALGAILAVGLSFGCDTGRGEQTARVPTAGALPGNQALTTVNRAFLAGYPWDEAAEFATHQWNPFPLIFVFEWLTAAFALRPLVLFGVDPMLLMWAWMGWLASGLLLLVIWSVTNSGGVPLAMLLTGVASFVLTAVLGIKFPPPPSRQVGARADRQDKQQQQLFCDAAGRIWNIPRARGLRFRRLGAGEESEDNDESASASQASSSSSSMDIESDAGWEAVYGVMFRYAEYCITAPLLFLAVVCLMTTDAPAWLFLTGYWLVLACNALGIALHMSVAANKRERHADPPTLLNALVRLLFTGPWYACLLLLLEARKLVAN